MAPTMADVARRAGVSISTVSHVINNTRVVKFSTREAILEAIHETGYTCNAVARSLVTASTKTVGLAICISKPYFANIIAAIEHAIRTAGYTLLLADTHDDLKLESQAVKTLRQRRVDGLLIAPVGGEDSATLHELLRLDVPTVLVDRFASDQFDQVGTENREATADLVRHMASLGRHRIGMISGIPGLQTTEERIDGYRDGLEAAGLGFDSALVRSGHSHAYPAELAVDQLLSMKDPPTALVVANNLMTIGALRALHRREVKIPEDIAFASFDDFEWAEFTRPRLTAIAQPIVRIGAEAASLILSRISDPKQGPRAVRLKPTFMHRDSCCPHQ